MNLKELAVTNTRLIGAMMLALCCAADLQAHVAGKVDNQWVGIEASAANDALRVQLNLPAGEGFVVEKVIPKTPAARAGIQQYNVLLRANGKTLGSIRDLAAEIDKALKAGFDKGEKVNVSIELLRAGKRQTVSFKPAVHITFNHDLRRTGWEWSIHCRSRAGHYGHN